MAGPDQSSQDRWRFPRAYYGDGNTEHKEVRMSTSGSVYVATRSDESIGVKGVSGSPVYLATEAAEKLWVKGTSSDVLYTIDKAHARVHDSAAFMAYKFTDALANAATCSLTFKTDTTSKYAHLLAEVRGGRFDPTGAARPVKYELWESATWTAQTGTQVSIVNRDRNSSAVSTLAHNGSASAFAADSLIGTAQTGITGGTSIDRVDLPPGERRTGEDRGSEFILKKNTQYALVATAFTDSTASIGIRMNWYEQA